MRKLVGGGGQQGARPMVETGLSWARAGAVWRKGLHLRGQMRTWWKTHAIWPAACKQTDWAGQELADQDKAGLSLARAALLCRPEVAAQLDRARLDRGSLMPSSLSGAQAKVGGVVGARRQQMDWAGQERADQDKAGLLLVRAALVGPRRGEIRTLAENRTVAAVGSTSLCTARSASMAPFTWTVMSVTV